MCKEDKICFNSRVRGGRDITPKGGAELSEVSTHASAGDATKTVYLSLRRKGVSTHASAGDATFYEFG